MKRVCLAIVISFLVCLLAAPSGLCSEKKNEPLTSEELQLSDKSIIHYPAALELFNAAKKSGIPFTADISNSDISSYVSKEKRSLNLGRLMSQASISVITRDADSLNTLANAVEALGKTFGVSETIENKKEAITDLVKQGKWDEVGVEMVQLETWVKDEIQAMRNPSAVVMANAAGMVTGLYYATKGLAINNSNKGSSFLRQPLLTADLIADLKTLPPSLQTTGLVKKIMDDLEQIKPLLSVQQGENISMENIKKLEKISGELVAEISK